MRQNCRSTIISLIKHIKSLQQNKHCSEAMLVVDELTSSLLSSVVYYFFALGVKNITKITLKKKPEHSCIGIYYLSPKSLKLIAEDFKGEATYHSVNILLSEEVTTQIMKSVATEAKVMERLAFFGELKLNTRYLDGNLGIICEEHRIFKALIRNEVKQVAVQYGNQLFQAIISGYGDSFILKVYHQNNQHILDILKRLGERYKEHQSYLLNKEKSFTVEEKGPTVIRLLLVDRKLDLVSPIVRNFYYFTMASEFFNVDYDRRAITVREGKTIELSFDDAIFNEYKNLHISKAQNSIEPNFKKFKGENKAAQLNKQKTLENMEIKHIIRDIPEFNRKISSYESQISIMYEISTLSKEQGIPQIGEVEQMIASGVNGHGEELKDKRIYQKAMEMAGKVLNQDHVVKIWLLLLFCNDLSESERKSLTHRIKQIPKYHNLGAVLQSKLSLLIPKPTKLKPIFKKEKIFLDLHECLASAIISEITERGTSKAVSLTIIGEQPKNEQSKFQKITKKQIKEWLVCMVGGLSINEISQLQRLETTYQNMKVNLLSDRIFTTWSYIEQLGTLFS